MTIDSLRVFIPILKSFAPVVDTGSELMQSGGTSGRGDWRVALLVPVGAGVPAGAKHDRPARRPVATEKRFDACPTQDARHHQILFFAAIILENPYSSGALL